MEKSSCVKLMAVLLLYHGVRRSSCQVFPIYLGCYKNFETVTEDPMAIQSAASCVEACTGHVLHFVGIKDGMACYCGNITHSRTLISNCDLPCAGGEELCGGIGFYSVYSDVPIYVGCFVQESAGLCGRTCLQNGYIPQTSRSRGCRCSITDFEERTNLTTTCQDDCLVDSTCELVQIFSINYFPGLKQYYTHIFHCNNEVTTMNGECPVPTCKPGWKGDRCEQRDCSVNNGDCGEHQCTSSNIAGRSFSDCSCKKGLTQGLTMFETCTDINECEEKPCMESTERCINTFKSYMCLCAPKHGIIKCDSEPCSQQLFACNGSECHKIRGFYKCRLQKLKPLKSTDKTSDKEAKFAGDISVKTVEMMVYICVGIIVCILTLILTRKIRKRHAGKSQFGVQDTIPTELGGNTSLKGIQGDQDD